MEALGATAACLEIGKTLFQLGKKIGELRAAPTEIKQIIEETTQLNNLLGFISRQHAAFSRKVQPIQEILDIEKQCQTAANDLLTCTRSLELKILRSKWKGSIKAICDKNVIEDHRRSLERAKASLMLAQQSFAIIQGHQQMLNQIETNILLQQLNVQQSWQPVESASSLISGIPPNLGTNCTDTAEIVRHNDDHTRYDRSQKILRYSMQTPTRWLGWALQLRAWRQFDEWTFNFRIWNYRAPDSPIFTLAHDGDVIALRRLLKEKNGFVTDLDPDGLTALHYAIEGYQFETAKLLLEHGADIDRRTTSLPGWSDQLTALEYFLETLPATDLKSIHRTATAAVAYAEDMWHLFTQYQRSDLIDNACGIWRCTKEWVEYGWPYEILDEMIELVLGRTWLSHSDLSLSDRLTICSDYSPGDPRMVSKWLGCSMVGSCPDGLYHYLASCMCNICWSPSPEDILSFDCGSALLGWRKLLAQVTAMEGSPNFGTTSVLKSLFKVLERNPRDMHEVDVSAYLTELTRDWVTELRLAGLTTADLKRFEDHERSVFPNSTVDLGCEYAFLITGVRGGPKPSSWHIYGHVLDLSLVALPSLSKLTSAIPGAWQMDESINEEGKCDEEGHWIATSNTLDNKCDITSETPDQDWTEFEPSDLNSSGPGQQTGLAPSMLSLSLRSYHWHCREDRDHLRRRCQKSELWLMQRRHSMIKYCSIRQWKDAVSNLEESQAQLLKLSIGRQK